MTNSENVFLKSNYVISELFMPFMTTILDTSYFLSLILNVQKKA